MTVPAKHEDVGLRWRIRLDHEARCQSIAADSTGHTRTAAIGTYVYGSTYSLKASHKVYVD